MTNGIVMHSPGRIDHGPAPDKVIDSLEMLGERMQWQHDRGHDDDSYRTILTIPNIRGELSRMSRDIGPWDDQIRPLLLGVLAVDPEISHVQIHRYIRDPRENEARTWHIDATLLPPSRRFDGGWDAGVAPIGKRLFYLAAGGENIYVANGEIVEDEPVLVIDKIVVPKGAALDSATAMIAAGCVLNEQLADATQTVIGHKGPQRAPYLINWRRGQDNLAGNFEVETTPGGHIIETPDDSVHIPPTDRHKGRTLLVASTKSPMQRSTLAEQPRSHNSIFSLLRRK